VCTFWGIASGLVGAVVVLMGVIAFNPMLRAGYDVKHASGVSTAGGTLGILIPPSVMIIVYAAVAGQSVVKLYAAAMFPGFFLSFLYLVYIIGWALIDPKIAPPLPEEQTRVKVPAWITDFQRLYSPNMAVALAKALLSPAQAEGLEIDGKPVSWPRILQNFVMAVMPLGILTVVVLAVILFGITTATESAAVGAAGAFLLAFHARTLDWKRTKEAVFLTAKTTAMVCWLFVGSALFSAVFAILGGQA